MHATFSMHRVKVYKLNSEGQWEDKGTGHISVEYMEVGTGGCPRLLYGAFPTMGAREGV